MHPLAVLLEQAARGTFPPVDGGVQVVRPERPGHWAIVEFTGHAVVVTTRTAGDVIALGADGFGGASEPRVKLALAGEAGEIGSHDAVLVAPGRGRSTTELTESDDFDDHPRVLRARRHRTSVRVYRGAGGLVTVGQGLVGRTEMSVALEPAESGAQGVGRALIESTLDMVPAGELIWAQVAPGNAASLRAFLAAGFTAIGAETLILTTP